MMPIDASLTLVRIILRFELAKLGLVLFRSLILISAFNEEPLNRIPLTLGGMYMVK